MPTVNAADAFIQTARTRLLTTAGLPAFKQWQNQRGKPPVTADWLSDAVIGWDEEALELGPNGLRAADIQYGVALYIPIGRDVQSGAALMHAVADVFKASPLMVLGRPCELTRNRLDNPRDEGPWVAWPLTLTFFHQYT